jgi:hypothetical protein
MSNDLEIGDIVIQLQQLQIRQSKLLERLELLNAGTDDKDSKHIKSTLAVRRAATARKFAIGDRVHIKNPRDLLPTRGTIIKINPKRITVLSESGVSIIRAPKNLTLE